MTKATALRLAIAGVAVAALAVAIRSFAPDADAAFALLARGGGVADFAVYLTWSIFAFALSGVAWWSTSGGPARGIGTYVWGRLVREAAADLLPFSQVGGIAFGAAAIASCGIPLALVYAAFVADLMTELASQLVFTAVGVAIFFEGVNGTPGALPLFAIVGGVGALVALVVMLTFAPATLRIATAFARRVVPTTVAFLDDVARSLSAIHARPARLAAAFLLNLAAWFVSAAGAFVALRLIDVDVPFRPVIALESLIFLLRSTAFAIPAGLGVQEAGYGLLGPLLGLPAEAILVLALVKRARDIAIAGPVLVAWQATRLVGRRHATAGVRS